MIAVENENNVSDRKLNMLITKLLLAYEDNTRALEENTRMSEMLLEAPASRNGTIQGNHTASDT